ncbi:hypothetical protein [Prescottella subtropica]|uniref:hypothetical protein n=1 Tax=Prescottella subtropica TaxID=2545757 RepID=UPI0010F4DEE2|nr:hypothetical protein [Prescottella subtropica]
MNATVTELHTVETFWTARPILTHIHDYARARRAAPWGTFGAILPRALACVGPNVQLPPTIGSPASLNVAVALVGPSGGGKGACEGASRDAVIFVDHNGQPIHTPELPLGSGEGVARSIRPAGTDDDEPNPNPRILFTAPEIDTLAALGARQGATIMGELRKVYSGEPIGFANASKATRSIVAAHSYRAPLIIGVQPLKAAPLLNDADGGMTQRILWTRVSDLTAPDSPPAVPDQVKVKLPRFGADTVYLEVPDTARTAMDAHRLAMLREGDVDPLDGHRMLTRLKVAAGLMILDGRSIVSDEDWSLAGVVIRESDRTRAGIERALTERARETNRARAEAKADEADIIADRADQRLHDRARAAVVRRLERGGPASRKLVRDSMRSELKRHLDAALTELIVEGIVAEQPGRYALA